MNNSRIAKTVHPVQEQEPLESVPGVGSGFGFGLGAGDYNND